MFFINVSRYLYVQCNYGLRACQLTLKVYKVFNNFSRTEVCLRNFEVSGQSLLKYSRFGKQNIINVWILLYECPNSGIPVDTRLSGHYPVWGKIIRFWGRLSGLDYPGISGWKPDNQNSWIHKGDSLFTHWFRWQNRTVFIFGRAYGTFHLLMIRICTIPTRSVHILARHSRLSAHRCQ